jgi:hypothetical protein
MTTAITTTRDSASQADPVLHQRYSIHGISASVRSHVPMLAPAIGRALGEFVVDAFPDGFHPTDGTLRLYDKAEVVRHLSPTAVAISDPREGLEVYQQDERFWLIDDRWGLVEINLLKGHWRSWVLPEPMVESDRVVEMAVLWPIAQLLRAKGLHVLPAAAVSRGNLGMLLVSPFSIEPELTALIRAGFRVIGQRWCALRDNEGRIEALHMPGRVERSPTPRLRSKATEEIAAPAGLVGINSALPVRPPATTDRMGGPRWIDLESEYCGSRAEHADIDTVILIDPGRRPTPNLRIIPPSSALPSLRRAWPIAELHPHRLAGQLPAKLSRRCRTYTARLSHRPQDLLDLLEANRTAELQAKAEAAAIHKTTAAIQQQIDSAKTKTRGVAV